MSNQADGIYSINTPVILAHPHLHEAKRFKGKNGKESGEPKFSAALVLASDHPDMAGLKSAAIAVAKAKWPNRDLKELKFPFADGNKIADKDAKKQADAGKAYNGRADFQKGKVVVKTSSKFQPKLAGIENGKLVDYETDAAKAASRGKFFFGAEVLAQVNFVAYDGVSENPDGVTAYINMVLTTGKGERLSGGASAAEVFKGYAGSVSQDDPTGGESIDDQIAF